MSKTRKIIATLTMVAVATTVSLAAVPSARALTPAEAAALGVLGGIFVGGAIANSRREAFPPPPVRRTSRSAAHVNWCDRRYRSYNVYSDTFTGYDGLQHYCNSPYSY